jgi:lipopolysaccharide export system protein LptC
MFINKFVLRAAGGSLAALMLLAAPRLGAQTPSESERLQKLERAVEQLQKRNAELEQEVSGLKKQAASTAEVGARMKTKIISEGKSYVEKAVVEEEKPPVFVVPRASEFKLVLGGCIQANFEDGDVSAFEGRFGQTAVKDRFRLRRARVNLTGDVAEQFDF